MGLSTELRYSILSTEEMPSKSESYAGGGKRTASCSPRLCRWQLHLTWLVAILSVLRLYYNAILLIDPQEALLSISSPGGISHDGEEHRTRHMAESPFHCLSSIPDEFSTHIQSTSTIKDSSNENDINNLPHVFIFMAAKAGGTSLKEFADDCYRETVGGDAFAKAKRPRDNFMNQPSELMSYLLQSLQVPKIVASHLLGPTPLLDTVRHASRKSIFIYVYREETDRLLSAIRHVVTTRLCNSDGYSYRKAFQRPIHSRKAVFGLELSTAQDGAGRKTCTFDEEPFVREVIVKAAQEVGFSVPSQLNCDVWGELQETGPDRFFFVHYSAVDHVQAALAAKYCPAVTPKRENVRKTGNSGEAGEHATSPLLSTASQKTSANQDYYSVRLPNSQQSGNHNLIELNEWLDAKKGALEFSLRMSGNRTSGTGPGSCKRRTRILEDAMDTCDSGMVQLLPIL